MNAIKKSRLEYEDGTVVEAEGKDVQTKAFTRKTWRHVS